MVCAAIPLSLEVEVGDGERVSALLQTPEGARACYVFAHGAGAGMEHPFMTSVADALADRSIATLRYQFSYMERGSKRPDTPKVAHAAVRAAVAEARLRLPELPLFAGGKSFGGRMTSQAQAAAPLPGVIGLAFLGFPLHPARKPSVERSEHLHDVDLPMLFLQGTRDDLAETVLIRTLVQELGPHATLKLFDGADHSFHVGVRSGRSDAQVLSEVVCVLVDWIEAVRCG